MVFEFVFFAHPDVSISLSTGVVRVQFYTAVEDTRDTKETNSVVNLKEEETVIHKYSYEYRKDKFVCVGGVRNA